MFVAPHMPWADNDLRASGDGAVAKGLWLCRLAHHHGHGRVKAQRLAECIADARKLPQYAEIGRGATDMGADGLRLCGKLRLPIGVRGDQIQRPCQGRGAGFMPRQKEDGDLIDHFFGRKNTCRCRGRGWS